MVVDMHEELHFWNAHVHDTFPWLEMHVRTLDEALAFAAFMQYYEEDVAHVGRLMQSSLTAARWVQHAPPLRPCSLEVQHVLGHVDGDQE